MTTLLTLAALYALLRGYDGATVLALAVLTVAWAVHRLRPWPATSRVTADARRAWRTSNPPPDRPIFRGGQVEPPTAVQPPVRGRRG